MKYLSATLLFLAANVCSVSAFVGVSHLISSGSSSRSGDQKSALQSASTHNRRPEWSPSSWREIEDDDVDNEAQMSSPDVERAARKIRRYAPLVFAGEIRTLQESLGRACQGQGFCLFGDDSAETLTEYKVDNVRDTFKAILQMSLILTYGCALPVIKIGRMVYRIQDGDDDDDDASNPLVEAYHQNAQTLNILRAFSSGGFADINRLHGWNLDFVEQTEEDSRYRVFAEKVDESLLFLRAAGVDTHAPTFSQVNFYTAHDCKLLPLEEALTREDSTTGKTYDCSAHMLYLRQPTARHLEFIRGIGNPLGLRITDDITPEQLLEYINLINPLDTPGKLSVVVRMDADTMRAKLGDLIRATQRESKHVLWIADPTYSMRETESGLKTRDFDSIRSELRAFFDVHEEMGSHPGGVHLSMTGADVSECVGGECDVDDSTLEDKYSVAPGCDPRLNGSQAIELAFLIAERMRKRSGLKPIA
mmetsp:Transcript_13147/g.28540  ORF Transcript_13147/g.28540 Transcript_13147/m.28540 type:complete len:477 (+) Transcript_13147:49-1479(+)